MTAFRVGIAGFLHESNTFLSVPTNYEHFASTSLTRGSDLLDRWDGSHHEIGGFIQGLRETGLEIVPLYATWAVPSGTITGEAFEQISAELLSSIRTAMPLDGILLALHGATTCATHRDADGEILFRVRTLVGSDLPVVVTLDLHANISGKMVNASNAMITYASNPHLDQEQRGYEAAVLLSRMLREKLRLVQAIETPPMLIQISKQHTAVEPARAIYGDVETVRQWPGIVSASAAMGFYYADVAEMGAAFLAVADRDGALARKAAVWMAERAWQRRDQFVGDLPTPSEAVRCALASPDAPVVLMDIGDNVGAGSPADSTILLAELLKQNVPDVLVILCDPESAAHCAEAGVGALVNLNVGGKTDRRHGEPVAICGQVRMLHDGKFVERQVRHGGWGICEQGLTALVETADQYTIILTSRRMAPMSLEQVLSLGIHPEYKRILIVKGAVAPRAAYEPVARKFILVDTPGVTSDDPRHFVYRYRRIPLFPLEPQAIYEPCKAVSPGCGT